MRALYALLIAFFMFSAIFAFVSCGDDDDDDDDDNDDNDDDGESQAGTWEFTFSGFADGNGEFIVDAANQINGIMNGYTADDQYFSSQLNGAVSGNSVTMDMVGFISVSVDFTGSLTGTLQDKEGNGGWSIILTDQSQGEGSWEATQSE